MPVAGPAGSNITIAGWRLDQYELDIWLRVMHLARNAKPGEMTTFTLRSMLNRLHSTVNRGSTDSEWLKQRLDNLAKTTISFEDDRYVGVAGSLVGSFRIHRSAAIAWPESACESAAHAVLASHVTWVPTRLDTLTARVGAEFARIRDFKSSLETVLDDFMARGWIHRYTVGRSDGGLVVIDKVRPPTQVRAVQRLQLTDDVDKRS